MSTYEWYLKPVTSISKKGVQPANRQGIENLKEEILLIIKIKSLQQSWYRRDPAQPSHDISKTPHRSPSPHLSSLFGKSIPKQITAPVPGLPVLLHCISCWVLGVFPRNKHRQQSSRKGHCPSLFPGVSKAEPSGQNHGWCPSCGNLCCYQTLIWLIHNTRSSIVASYYLNFSVFTIGMIKKD